MDITNNERMRLAASAYRAYIQHAAEMELPLVEDDIEDDILADLIAGLHHYADTRGLGFDSAGASGQAAYDRHRAGEDNPYRIGDESISASGQTPGLRAVAWWCRSSPSATVSRPTTSAFPARLTPLLIADLLTRRNQDRHANYRITLGMYVGTTAVVLNRVRQATQ